jgi:acetolactate synthase-1/2/3 large subunit
MKGAQAVGRILIEAGISHVFGIPGGTTVPIFRALWDVKDKVRVVLTRHEQTAAQMADMYGRMTGKPALLMGQGLWIGTNAGIGIAEAFVGGSPMVIVVDQSGNRFSQHGIYQLATGDYGGVNLPEILRSMTKYVSVATSAKEIAQGLQLAIKHSLSGYPGPASIIFRDEALAQEIDEDQHPRLYGTQGYIQSIKPAPQVENLERVLNALISAKKPVIISGHGVRLSRAFGPLEDFAVRLRIPTATTYGGKGTFADSSELSLGTISGYGSSVARSIVSQADTILAIGTKLGPSDTLREEMVDPVSQRVFAIDIEPRHLGWSLPIEMGILSDADCALRSMLKLAEDKRIDLPNHREAWFTQIIEEKRKFKFGPEYSSSAKPILPQRIIGALNEVTDIDTIICLDAGNNRIWATNGLQVKKAGNLYTCGGIAGMGWGMPAAFVAKMLNPKKKVITLVGDGGFVMTMNTLFTAVHYEIPFVTIVMNDGGFGTVRDLTHGQCVSDFGDFDHAAIAKTIGCAGMRVTDPADIDAVFRDALRQERPTVVDVVTSPTESHMKITAPGVYGEEV